MLGFVAIGMGGEDVSCRKCMPCPAQAAYRPYEEVLSEVRSAFSSWRGPSGPNLALQGAPLGFPRLNELLEEAVRAGASRLRLEGEMALLADEGVCESVVASGVRHVRARVLAGAEEHDVLAGRPGGFARVRRGLTAFQAAARQSAVDVLVTVEVPVCVHNLRETPAAVAVSADAGARAVVLSLSPSAAALGDAAAWVGAACDTGAMSATWVAVLGIGEEVLAAAHRPHVRYAVEEATCPPC